MPQKLKNIINIQWVTDMKRKLSQFLSQWLKRPRRLPIVLRGARQVGKTWLVRNLAEREKLFLIELNFEKNPKYIDFFDTNDPKIILENISAEFNRQIETGKTLLFLDEIQTAPHLLSKLRWFAEDLPELAVITAGSLLEFVLADHSFSMPVGRINYLHLEPMSFEEFLWAKDQEILSNYLNEYTPNIDIPKPIHEKFLSLFKEYLFIGGLPKVVLDWVTDNSLTSVNLIKNDLINTYRDDFRRYNTRISIQKIDDVLMAVPTMLGQKFVFSNINPDIQSYTVKTSLDLLEKARVCYRVKNVAANGIPLGAEINRKFFKEILLDVGLCSTALGLNFHELASLQEIIMINRGGIAEQVVGQLLRTINPPYTEPELFYWHKESKRSNAEVDYVIQFEGRVIPIEVKAGKTGSLKSLHLFMAAKKLPFALRINSDLPMLSDVELQNTLREDVKYKLLSLPFYLIEQIPRLLEALILKNK